MLRIGYFYGLITLTVLAISSQASTVSNTTDAERLVRCLKVYAPEGWKVETITRGPQQVPKRHGEKPEGTCIRFSASQPDDYLDLYIVPRPNHLKKDFIIFDWFQPKKGRTVRVWRNDNFVILGNGAHAQTWPTWKKDIRRKLVELSD